LAEAETFTQLATVETQRRGSARAETVCAVSDGAEWIQGFFDVQCHTAVRILDFYHAAGYVAKIGQAHLGAGTSAFQTWLTTTLHELKHGSPDQVLQALREVQRELQGGSASPETLDEVRTALQYLETRRPHMEYARFQAAGYPIGSGSVESGNKLVVEARMKGAGMHWAREHVNPMLGLRDVLCSDRWDKDWSQIALRLRKENWEARLQRQRARRLARTVAKSSASTSTTSLVPPVSEPSSLTPRERSAVQSKVATRAKSPKPYRPPADHPWRHSPIGRARFKPYRSGRDPKL
jgi:hypothetical protein